MTDNSSQEKPDPFEWLALARFIFAALIAIGGVSLAYRWGSSGYPVAAWVALFGTVGALGGMYPGDDDAADE